MRTLIKTKHGSMLYGTNVPTSDTDYKGVMMPHPKDVLLGISPKTYTQNTNSAKNQKNSSEDIDLQYVSLKKFLSDIANGQTYAYEILFAPPDCWEGEVDPLWHQLLANKDKMISKNVSAMVGYAKAQAYKYGQKGKRYEVYQGIVDLLEKIENLDSKRFLVDDLTKTDAFKEYQEKHAKYVKYDMLKIPDTHDPERLYLDINGTFVPGSVTVQYAHDVYSQKLERYGDRAKQAAIDKGNDLKAIMHAYRISEQAIEMLQTGAITFPCRDRELLLKIRLGEFSNDEMTQMIDDSFARLEKAVESSTLPEKCDEKWMEEFLINATLRDIQNYFGEVIKVINEELENEQMEDLKLRMAKRAKEENIKNEKLFENKNE